MLPETLKWEGNSLYVLDQTMLPWEVSYVECNTYSEVANAITTLQVRGAPAIGIAAAYGVALAAKDGCEYIDQAIQCLAGTRPTAVNLFWSLDRMKKKIIETPEKDLYEYLLEEARAIHLDDIEINRAIGEQGASLLKGCSSVLTHCNAGALATGGHGTALGVIRTASATNTDLRVYADETRPVLQGARLTVWELMQDNIDVTLICDSMAASLMQKGIVDAVIVGADRIASNGDVANKIGTYQLAVVCKYHSVPFYVAAPLSTFDWSLSMGSEIPIEERPGEEILGYGVDRSLPMEYQVYNPAFDVTPAELVTAIITEAGVIKDPVSQNIKRFA
jgi:methylthioribose-1-phosphate isomerase